MGIQDIENIKERDLQDLGHLDLALIFENTNDNIWAVNSEYKILYANHVFKSMFYDNFGVGLSLGDNLIALTLDSLRDFWKSQYDRALQNEAFSFVTHVKAQDVSFYLEVFMNPIVVDGKIEGVLAFGRDITERKRKEEELERSRLLLKSSLESQKDTIFLVINKDYEYTYFNLCHAEAMKHTYGVAVEEGMNILDCIPNEADRVVVKDNFDRALKGESHSNVRVFGEKKPRYYESFFNPMINEEGEVVGVTATSRDVTDRKEEELELERSRLYLKSSLENQRDTIILSINHNYEYLFFNPRHAEALWNDYGTVAEIGKNVLEGLTNKEDRDVAKDFFDHSLAGKSSTLTRMFGEKNRAYYECFVNPMTNENNEIIGATVLARDVSERKKSEKTLIESEQKLRELSAAKDKIFSIIAHDLRSPFNCILGFSELLIEKFGELTLDEREEYLEYIHSSAKNTLGLLDDLLNWAKSQTQKISINPNEIILSRIISEVVKFEEAMAKAKDISLNYLMASELKVYADENVLKIILGNLISNAIKFTPEGGEIYVTKKIVEDWVEITVSDNGVGISEEKYKTLFNLSSYSSTAGTANEKGSGLGLLLCKELVDEYGGKIWVESEEGRGSDFKFTLPLKKEEPISKQ